MGLIKTLERSSKRRLMRLVGKFVSSEIHDLFWFRDTSFKKILVIRQHNQMGDMLLAIPALRAIRETHPGAEIGVITSTLNRDVLLNNPYIDRLFTYDKKNPLSHARLIRNLRKERYDLVIVIHTVSFSFTSVLLAVLSGARVRVGSTSKNIGDDLNGSYYSLTLPLPEKHELESMNEAEHNLYPLKAIGIGTKDLSPLLVPMKANYLWAADFEAEHWRGGGLKLVVHPGAGKNENIWPPESFARVINGLNKIKPVNLAVVEGPRDATAVAEFTRVCGVEAAVVRGRGVGDVAALMLKADLVICNDTGVMHVSAAAGARTLAVFGPTDPFRWAPRAKLLYTVRAPEGRLTALRPDDVKNKAAEILGLIPGAESNT